jgi:hypothetical protein
LVVSPLSFQPGFTFGVDGSATFPFEISSTAGGFVPVNLSVTTASGGQWLNVDGRQSDTVTLSSGAPTAGISLTANPGSLVPGVYTGSLIVSSPNASNALVTVPVTMTIRSKLQITTTSLPVGTWGQAYPSTQLQATGGTGYVWELESGTLPTGLALSPSGMISGTLANADYPQNFTFNIQVTDSLGRPTYTTFILVVRVPVNVTTYAPTNFLFNAGTTYVQPPNGNNSITFLASGGIPPYAWSAAGLPSGLNIDRVTGTILGTPAQAGTFPITITAIDSQGTSGTLAWNLQVVAPPLIIMNNTLPSGTVGVPYNQFLNAQRGSQSGYTWTVQGILPPGLTA